LEPGTPPGYRPGEVWCGDHPKIGLYSTECTTTLENLLEKLPNSVKK
jgi:hypothetical protein